MKPSFIVWVGGLPDYEGGDYCKAYQIYKEWLMLGYDDVQLEEIRL